MNKTTTMTMCVVMLMIGMAFTAVAATRSDSSGATSFSVSGVSNLGTYTILNETFVVVNDPTQDYCGYQFTRTNVIVDMEDIPEMSFVGSNIVKLILTEKVKTVAENAFSKNKSLISVSRSGTGELSVAENAFKDCTALKYIDLRGDVTVGEGAFPSGLTAMRAMDMDGEAPYASGDAVRVKDTGGEIAVTMYDGTYLRVCYKGSGMLQLVDGDNNRATYSTGSGNYTTYSFTPFSGKDMTLGYRVVHIKYNLDDIPDVDAEIKTATYKLVDLTGGVTPTTWKGWKDRVSSQYIVKDIDHEFINRYCNNAGSVLDLVSEADSYTIYYNVSCPAEGEEVKYPAPSGGNGTTKYPALESEHYIVVGWYRNNDSTQTVHPVGSYIRYFDLQYINAVWEPKAEFIYELQYTNVDGTDLGEPESYGYAQKASVKTMVPYDETPTQKIDGWRLEGSEDVLHEGDTVKITEDTKLYPVLKDRSDVTVTFDNDGSKQTMTVKDGYPTPITIEDPKDAYRLFIGWTKAGTEWALMKGDDVTADTEITLTPTWRDKLSYRVSYMSDGLQIGDTQTILETDEVRVHKDVTKNNHRLSGWSDGTDVVEDGSDYSVTKNVTFTAVWTELEKHTVTYHLADGTTASKSVYVGSTVKVAADPGTRQGYDFLGWSTIEGVIAEYCNGDSMEVVTDTELYPVWMRNGDPLPEPEEEEDEDTDSGDTSGGDTTEGKDQSTEEGTKEPDTGDSKEDTESEGDPDTGDTSGDTSGDTDTSKKDEQQETTPEPTPDTTPEPAPTPAPRPTPVYPIYPDYDDEDDDDYYIDEDDEPADEDTDDYVDPVEPEPDQDSTEDTTDDADADGDTEETDDSGPLDDTTDDGTSDDGTVPIDTSTDSDSGSGGSGIPTGAGIAVLAAVSALVAGYMAVMLRRS